MGEHAESEHNVWEEKEPDWLVKCRLVDMADVTAPEKGGVWEDFTLLIWVTG